MAAPRPWWSRRSVPWARPRPAKPREKPARAEKPAAAAAEDAKPAVKAAAPARGVVLRQLSDEEKARRATALADARVTDSRSPPQCRRRSRAPGPAKKKS